MQNINTHQDIIELQRLLKNMLFVLENYLRSSAKDKAILMFTYTVHYSTLQSKADHLEKIVPGIKELLKDLKYMGKMLSEYRELPKKKTQNIRINELDVLIGQVKDFINKTYI